jgi:hypothetical protein
MILPLTIVPIPLTLNEVEPIEPLTSKVNLPKVVPIPTFLVDESKTSASAAISIPCFMTKFLFMLTISYPPIVVIFLKQNVHRNNIHKNTFYW